MVQKRYAAGFDIGGTKCATVIGEYLPDGSIAVRAKQKFATADFREPQKCLAELSGRLDQLIQEMQIDRKTISGVGISCGGPLDPERGLIQSPPNLPGWDDVPAVKIVREMTGLPVRLENDANACALAEWKFGAGRGSRNMIFLTFGTGMGAGIIMNGQMCSGKNGMAGEAGHIRLAPSGPCGYGKDGSFEGFCSGGGIAAMGRMYAEAAWKAGRTVAWCSDQDSLSGINAAMLAEAAFAGDKDALEIYRECGRRLGEGLSILIDILNPEIIVIGSIFARAEKLLRAEMERSIRKEALKISAEVCRIVPAQLGESIGDIASLSLF